jgi:hypothetical protein
MPGRSWHSQNEGAAGPACFGAAIAQYKPEFQGSSLRR